MFIREAASCNACLLVLTAICSWVSWDMASSVLAVISAVAVSTLAMASFSTPFA